MSYCVELSLFLMLYDTNPYQQNAGKRSSHGLLKSREADS